MHSVATVGAEMEPDVGGYPKNSEYYPNTSDSFRHVQ
jgi:hypothetical protein